MPDLDPELHRALALRAISGNLLRAKWHVAALRFELALRRHDRALKYNPDQPRVPGGVREGGRWTAVYGGYPLSESTRHPNGGAPPLNRVAADNQRQNKWFEIFRFS